MRTPTRFVFALTLVAAAAALAEGPALDAQDADVPHRTGRWDTDALGNHRVVVRVAEPADAVWAHIPWRRRDTQPARKEILVVAAGTGVTVDNVARIEIGRESGDLVFEARAAGDYYVYYLPTVSAGSPNYPTVVYPRPRSRADAAWMARHRLGADDRDAQAWKALPRADVVAFESIDDFHSLAPMEIIATGAETEALVARHPDTSLLVFPENRRLSIRMTDDLPLKWIRDGAMRPLEDEALRGEFYAFQLGVYAARTALSHVQVGFSDLRGPAGATIPAAAFRCINLGGLDWRGRPFTRAVAVERGKVQPLWCGVEIPESATPGRYRTSIAVSADGQPPASVSLSLDVQNRVVPAHGDDEPWRLSRLRWLDSTLAQNHEVVRPFQPITGEARTLNVLGREVSLTAEGLPRQIRSHFLPEMTGVGDRGRDVLASPVTFTAASLDGTPLTWTGDAMRFTDRAPARVAWAASRSSDAVKARISGTLEADGTLEYEIAITADRPTALSDVRLEVPLAADVARYMMGLGFKGGRRPASYEWTWDVTRNQDAVWVGDVNAGLQLSLYDDTYVRPLNTNFYLQKPLVMPRSWANGGKGGCRLAERGAAFVIACRSGSRMIEPGETLRYDFRLMVTPFKPLDTRAQWTTRFYHRYTPVAEVKATGANTINVHHANAINPWINYPFLRPAEMKAYIDEAHAQDMRVKIYYTVRELSNRAPELFALRSLGDEVLSKGPGGGFSWLQEHLGGDYIAAWFVPDIQDAAVINSGVSRWHNYYVEGLAWLVRHVGIDGLYIDDVAFDRVTMKRVRKVLDGGRPDALIDLHSANQYNVRDGYASSANLYLEHFPYINRLWFGEYFDYDASPDYWLVEMSGIPFGLMGEMLEGGGNPWRGMVFGMTSRLPWAGDPRPLWKVWDAFGIADSRMIGWWVPEHPVKTGRDDVLATVYLRPGKALVAVASWAKDPVDVRLAIDWPRLGLDPARARVAAPAIENFQEAAEFAVDAPLPVQPGRGWLLVVEGR